MLLLIFAIIFIYGLFMLFCYLIAGLLMWLFIFGYTIKSLILFLNEKDEEKKESLKLDFYGALIALALYSVFVRFFIK